MLFIQARVNSIPDTQYQGKQTCVFNLLYSAWHLFSSSIFLKLILCTMAIALPQEQWPQQHMLITVGLCHQTHPVNLTYGRKPEYPEENHDFRQMVDIFHFSITSIIKTQKRIELAMKLMASGLATSLPKSISIFLFYLTLPQEYGNHNNASRILWVQ